MAYKGGGIFIILYILFAILLGHPLIEMESAIGRYARTNAIDVMPKERNRIIVNMKVPA